MNWRLLPRAVRDLAEIESFIRRYDPAAAASVASRLAKSFELLSRKPDIGRPLPRTGVREWSVPGLPYIIPYRTGPAGIEILRVWHTRRKAPEFW